MPDGPDADVVRVSIPPDGGLSPVLEVAVGVLARRLRIDDATIEVGRAAVGVAFVEVARGAGTEPVTIELRLAGDQLVVRLAAGGDERSVTVSAASGPSG